MMRSVFICFFIFIFSLHTGYSRIPVNETKAARTAKEITVTADNLNDLDFYPVMMGNPNSAWNRWGKKTLAFTATVAAGVGIGFGIGSVVPGVGTTSGIILGAVGGLLGGIAVLRNMQGPE